MQSEEAAVSEPTASAAPVTSKTVEDDDIVVWVQAAMEAADDKLGHETSAYMVGDILGITEWFVITSGKTDRQVRAITESIEEVLTERGGPKPVRIEGMNSASWVLMDYGFFVVHVFDEETRDYYELERLWKDVPRMERPAA